MESYYPFSDERPDSAKSIFSRRLKASIRLNGFSQARFAKELKTTPQAISSYVNGKTTPDYDTLRTIARLLGISIDYLLGR